MLLQLILQGIATGALYALVAVGFTLVFRALHQVIFSQGQVFMAGTFLGYLIVTRFHLGAGTAILAVAVSGVVIGVVLDRLVWRALYDAEHMPFVIAAIGLGIILENGVRVFYPEPVKFPPIFGTRVIDIGGARIAEPYFWVIGVAILLILGLHLFFTYSRPGQAMRAVAADREIASTMGVNVDRYMMLTFTISVAVAAVAGLLVGPLYFASFDMGDMVGVKAFSAAVLGGLGSIPGAIAGGLVLGVLENLAAGYVSSGYKDAVALALLILMLVVRPQGLLGRATPTKA